MPQIENALETAGVVDERDPVAIPVKGGRERALEIAMDEIERLGATSSGLGNVVTTLLARDTRLADRIRRSRGRYGETVDELVGEHAFDGVVVRLRETTVPEREIERQC